jgi:hypothetical protein
VTKTKHTTANTCQTNTFFFLKFTKQIGKEYGRHHHIEDVRVWWLPPEQKSKVEQIIPKTKHCPKTTLHTRVYIYTE